MSLRPAQPLARAWPTFENVHANRAEQAVLCAGACFCRAGKGSYLEGFTSHAALVSLRSSGLLRLGRKGTSAGILPPLAPGGTPTFEM